MTVLGIVLIAVGCVVMILSSYFAVNFEAVPLARCSYSCSQLSYVFLFVSIAVAVIGFVILLASLIRRNKHDDYK